MTKHNHWGSVIVTPETLGFTDRLFLALSMTAVVVLSFPHITAAATLQAMPLVFETDNLQGVQTAKVMTVAAETEAVLHAAPDPRAVILREYLASKESPMADYADALLRHDKFRFIVGISFAESNFCRAQIRPNNCWGIGGGYPESYPTMPDAFERANQLITRYHDQGMITPRLMRTTWVGWHNDNWIVAVEQVMAELRSLGL